MGEESPNRPFSPHCHYRFAKVHHVTPKGWVYVQEMQRFLVAIIVHEDQGSTTRVKAEMTQDANVKRLSPNIRMWDIVTEQEVAEGCVEMNVCA